MPFPVIKLAYLAIRQISKPIANWMKVKAKDHGFLRKRILIPPAQAFHALDTRLKMRTLGLGKSTQKVQPLNEEMAVELGADMLGEFIIFSIAAMTMFWEYTRQKRNDRVHESTQDKRMRDLEGDVRDMKFEVAEQSTRLKELHRLLAAIPAPQPTQQQTTEMPTEIINSHGDRILVFEKPYTAK